MEGFFVLCYCTYARESISLRPSFLLVAERGGCLKKVQKKISLVVGRSELDRTYQPKTCGKPSSDDEPNRHSLHCTSYRLFARSFRRLVRQQRVEPIDDHRD